LDLIVENDIGATILIGSWGLPLLPEVAAVIQERTWGLPIWFAPQKLKE
jgi:hypothetical protein